MRAKEFIAESIKQKLMETLKSLRLPDMEIRIDMDHLINRMAQRNLFDRYKEVDYLLRNIPMEQLREVEPGQQFWLWDKGRKMGLGFRKLNTMPTLMLKTAISNPPKGDRNPIIYVDTSSLGETKLYIPTNKITNESIIDFLRKSAKEDISTYQRMKIVETMAKNEGHYLNEILDRKLADDIKNNLMEFSVKDAIIGEKYIPLSIDVFNDAIMVYDVIRNSPPVKLAKFGELIDKTETKYVVKIDNYSYNYPYNSIGNYAMMLTGLFDSVDNYDKFRMIMKLKYDVDLPPVANISESASGYIPSKKEKNDPRYKTALTVDVKPDTMKKNAKAFGFNISRAGIPKDANTNGKI